jgi:hypothetical protein
LVKQRSVITRAHGSPSTSAAQARSNPASASR